MLNGFVQIWLYLFIPETKSIFPFAFPKMEIIKKVSFY